MSYDSKEKMREFQRNWLKARRQRFINMAGGKCKVCKSKENLEFDHIIPSSKTASVNTLMSGKISRLVEEIVKCQLLCKPCHHAKTMKEEYKEPEHGTMVMYRDNKCRCDRCVENNERRSKIKRRK